MLFLLFEGCEKNEAILKNHTSQVTTREGLHDLAKLLIVDRKTGGALHKILADLNTSKKEEEFMLIELKEKGIAERAPSAIDEILEKNPLIEIAYPSYGFQTLQNFSQYINSIQYYVVLDENIDLDVVSTLPAYDSNGNAVNISSTFDPTIKYAVIKVDEAHDAVYEGEAYTIKGQIVPSSLSTFPPSSEVGNLKYYEEATIINADTKDKGPKSGGPVTYRGGGGGAPVCDRPANKKDQLYKIRFSNKDAVQVIENGFHLPNVELFFTYVFAIVNPVTSTYTTDIITVQVDKNWSLMNGPDWNSVDLINQQIKTWTDVDSDVWKVGIIERDFNSDTESGWTFGLSPTYTVNKTWAFSAPVSYTIKKKKKDKLAGEVLIEYCDAANGEGTSYKVYTGGNDGMFFRENFQQN